ncbi:hypothetical protein RHSIM_Rhsim02G0013400 [Rhododendron simsii]|uniref:Uncharacterized protein n=1 Tax=Rhododendron simsii TaxID=118357 RepID=A0A834LYL0_RHOSS|nr:hypothetical protein RHSIM_Rhsim02G0013400 [Rhododendron simsii]
MTPSPTYSTYFSRETEKYELGTMIFTARNYFRSFVVVCLAMANAFVAAQEEEDGGGGDVKGTIFLVVIVLIALVILMPTQRRHHRHVYPYRCP